MSFRINNQNELDFMFNFVKLVEVSIDKFELTEEFIVDFLSTYVISNKKQNEINTQT